MACSRRRESSSCSTSCCPNYDPRATASSFSRRSSRRPSIAFEASSRSACAYRGVKRPPPCFHSSPSCSPSWPSSYAAAATATSGSTAASRAMRVRPPSTASVGRALQSLRFCSLRGPVASASIWSRQTRDGGRSVSHVHVIAPAFPPNKSYMLFHHQPTGMADVLARLVS
eukprot:2085964-Prymnesium_polylepis.2